MLQRLRLILFSESNKNTFILLYGTVLSQALPLIFSPFLARLYSPAEFGAFSLFFGIIAILGNISAGKLDLALYTAKTKDNAIATALTGLVFTALITTLITIGCLFVAFFSVLEKLSIAAVICIPFTVFFLGSSNILTALSNREKKFKNISNSKILLGVLWVAVNLVLGFLDVNEMGLILGYCIGQFAAVAYLFYMMRNEIASVRYNFVTFKFNLLRNRNFALIFLPAHLLNTASASAPSFFLSYFFGLNANGLFF